MFDDLEKELFELPDALEALGELEQNTDQAVLAQRSTERLSIHTKVTIRHGDASRRAKFAVEGITADLSNGGSMILVARPLYPGDLFWLTFAETHVRIGSLLARCVRCRYVQEDAFEIGFRFLETVDVRSALVQEPAYSG